MASSTNRRFPTSTGTTSDYAITLQLVDEDGTHDNDVDFTAHIVNVVPVLTIQGAPSVNEGSAYTLTLSTVFDPGDDLVDRYEVDWGDGASESFASLGDVTHVYYGEAERTITVDLRDEEGTYVGASPMTAFTSLEASSLTDNISAGTKWP